MPSLSANPTGVVFNGGAAFNGDRFLFATAGGAIAGWQSALGTTAATRVSSAGSVYTGLASGNNGSGDFLYAANFSGGTIEVFDSSFAPTFWASSFSDPTLPNGYAPFNIQNIGGSLLVTYAGSGGGIVDKFDMSGNFLQRLISNSGVLDSPWGLALAPASFGEFGGHLLVGNVGDGKINAFDLNGNFKDVLKDSLGNPIVIDGLHGLIFGNGGNGGDPNKLYFTAGTNNGNGGLFGSLAPVPVPSSLILLGAALVGLAGWRRKLGKT